MALAIADLGLGPIKSLESFPLSGGEHFADIVEIWN